MALGQLLKIPVVSDYIFEADFDGAIDDVIAKYALPKERADELLHLINALLDDVVTVPQLPAVLEQAFGITSDQAKLVAADLVGKTLLPLLAYFPGLDEEIVKLGGKIEDYPKERIAKDKAVQTVILQEVLVGLQIEFTDVLAKRLRFLLEQYVNKEKTEDSLKTFFTRSQNVGGLGLPADKAAALLAAVLPQANMFVTDVPGVAAEVPVVDAPAPSTTPVTTSRFEPTPAKQEIAIAPSHELAAEVPVVNKPEKSKVEGRRSKPEAPIDPNELKTQLKRATAVRKQVAPAIDALASTVTAATSKVTAILKSKKISEKVFADVAGKAIRGLRDIYQTRDLIEREWKLKGEDLTKVMTAIADGVGEYEGASRAKDGGQGRAQPEQARSESDELDEKFASLTKPVGKSDAPEKAKAQLTVGSVSMGAGAGGQRKMVDIVSSNRLAGPIEQLGKMTPAEFRRLASDPSEAGQKIDDLLSALEKTSYEERVKGVLAWRESPMNQLYLKITEEALSAGLALPEISSKRRAAGQDSLSPGEVKALALLNAKIRF